MFNLFIAAYMIICQQETQLLQSGTYFGVDRIHLRADSTVVSIVSYP